MLMRITGGEWVAGDALPNEFALASEYKVSVGTIRKAMEGLEEQGLLVRKQGRGTYIAGNGRNPLEEKFTSLRAPHGDERGLTYQLENFIRRAATNDECCYLNCTPASEIIEIEQIVKIGDEPAGIETTVVDAATYPRLETQLVYGQHLYSIYSLYGVLVTRTSDIVSVTQDNPDLARRLGLASNASLLAVKRVAFTHERQPVEYRVSAYRPEKILYCGMVS